MIVEWLDRISLEKYKILNCMKVRSYKAIWECQIEEAKAHKLKLRKGQALKEFRQNFFRWRERWTYRREGKGQQGRKIYPVVNSHNEMGDKYKIQKILQLLILWKGTIGLFCYLSGILPLPSLLSSFLKNRMHNKSKPIKVAFAILLLQARRYVFSFHTIAVIYIKTVSEHFSPVDGLLFIEQKE